MSVTTVTTYAISYTATNRSGAVHTYVLSDLDTAGIGEVIASMYAQRDDWYCRNVTIATMGGQVVYTFDGTPHAATVASVLSR